MSILYLKPLPKISDEKLPDIKGALSGTVPPLAITKANKKYQNSANSSRKHM